MNARLTIDGAPIALSIDEAEAYVRHFVRPDVKVLITGVQQLSSLMFGGESKRTGVDIAAELVL